MGKATNLFMATFADCMRVNGFYPSKTAYARLYKGRILQGVGYESRSGLTGGIVIGVSLLFPLTAETVKREHWISYRPFDFCACTELYSNCEAYNPVTPQAMHNWCELFAARILPLLDQMDTPEKAARFLTEKEPFRPSYEKMICNPLLVGEYEEVYRLLRTHYEVLSDPESYRNASDDPQQRASFAENNEQLMRAGVGEIIDADPNANAEEIRAIIEQQIDATKQALQRKYKWR